MWNYNNRVLPLSAETCYFTKPSQKNDQKLLFSGDKGEGHDGGSKEGGFVSSLFNHNPEIPRLNLTNAEPQKEAVFSAKTFAETGVHPYISKTLADLGMEKLTLVQSKAIPVVLSGKDALIKSQTGSGKTLAYAVPILHKLQVRFIFISSVTVAIDLTVLNIKV